MDKTNCVSRQQLKDALINLGVNAGMVLEVHSSLSSFGHLEGGAMTLIDTLKEIVTPEGSIFMPALRLSPEYELTEEDRKNMQAGIRSVLPVGENMVRKQFGAV